MTALQIDYLAVFQQLPVPVLLLTPEFAVADANAAFLSGAGRTRGELLGRNVFDTFQEDPSDPGATGVHNSCASLRRVLATGQPDVIEFQRYDIEVPGRPGVFEKHFYSAVNAPVFGPDGPVVLIANCGEDVTNRMARFMSVLAAEAEHDGVDSGGELA
jgi:PAS domain-containing protein